MCANWAEASGQRLHGYAKGFRPCFRVGKRQVAHHAITYAKGLMQAPNQLRNMERMQEQVPDTDYDQLQHFLSDSPWDHKAVMDGVAMQAHELIGGHADTCLILDESGFAKKGKESAGVARQWNGRLGKIDNCQVGVFAVLNRGQETIPIGAHLYLPEEWTENPTRCQKAKIPQGDQTFQTKQQLALNLVERARTVGVHFSWIAADGVYGGDTGLLRELDERGETFVMDVRSNQPIFLADPEPTIPPAPEQGRPTTIPRSDAASVRVDAHIRSLAAQRWRKVRVRRSTSGDLHVDALAIPVWIWPQKKGRDRCHQWTLIVTRNYDSKEDVKYALTNAPKSTALRRLAFMQRQRFWIEHALKEAKSTCGLADYQVRSWIGWHHHVALVMMVHLFLVKERRYAPNGLHHLSANDVRALLVHALPRPEMSAQNMVEQIQRRIEKRGLNDSG